jgi:hypothetical protein
MRTPRRAMELPSHDQLPVSHAWLDGQTGWLASVFEPRGPPPPPPRPSADPASYADEISIFDFGMRPGPSAYARPGPGRAAR